MLVDCPSTVVKTTLNHLRKAGQHHCECVVLWLGQRDGKVARVKDAYLPIQLAKGDMFYIPPVGLSALHSKMRRYRVMVAAQVHSHPGIAFHSETDDQWAIVRHTGALSLVVPNFASSVTVTTFLENTKVYQYSDDANWVEVVAAEIGISCLRIT